MEDNKKIYMGLFNAHNKAYTNWMATCTPEMPKGDPDLAEIYEKALKDFSEFRTKLNFTSPIRGGKCTKAKRRHCRGSTRHHRRHHRKSHRRRR
jgi:hypothetical protein